MRVWEDLVRAALVGTKHQEVGVSGADGAVEGLLSRLDGADREGTLLAAAGAAGLARRAGALPPTVGAEAVPPPAEEDDVPRCPPAAANALATILAGEYREALPQWLALAAGAKVRVPEEMLQQLLEHGRNNREHRAGIGAVLGKRGRWLAARNKEWDFALQKSLLDVEDQDFAEVQKSVKELWETGTRGERTSALATVRAKFPAEARAMLEAVWKAEPPEERAAFIQTLETNLSLDDDAFLDAALDDKRKEVRTVARDLLLRLPGSAYLRRAGERLAPLIYVTQNGNVNVKVPDAYDKAWARDGIEEKVPAYGRISQKTHWAQQLVAVAPLAFWTEHLGKTPLELLEANNSQDWKDELRRSWNTATNRERNPAWAAAFMEFWIRGQVIPDNIPWRDIFPREQLETYALRMLRENDTDVMKGTHPVLAFLPQIGGAVGPELAGLLIERIRNADRKNVNYYWSYTMVTLLPFIPDEHQDEFLRIWGELIGSDNYYKQAWSYQTGLRQFLKEMIGKFGG